MQINQYEYRAMRSTAPRRGVLRDADARRASGGGRRRGVRNVARWTRWVRRAGRERCCLGAGAASARVSERPPAAASRSVALQCARRGLGVASAAARGGSNATQPAVGGARRWNGTERTSRADGSAVAPARRTLLEESPHALLPVLLRTTRS